MFLYTLALLGYQKCIVGLTMVSGFTILCGIMPSIPMDSLVHEGIGERWNRFTQLFSIILLLFPARACIMNGL